MRKLLVLLFVVLLGGSFFISQHTPRNHFPEPTTQSVYANLEQPFLSDMAALTPPNLNVKAWAVLDADTGRIIAGKDINERIEPASLTKLMTASLVFSALQNKQISLNQNVTVSEKAWRTGGSRMFIEVNKPVSINDLITGMLVVSGNDATVQLSQVVGGNEDSFVSMMNEQAKKFGMTHSHFANPTGLPNPDHYTTVHDLAILAMHIVKDYPNEFHYFSIRSYTFDNITQANRNGLLNRDLGVDGLKTGHTDAAGYCLIATAKRNGRRLISLVVGAHSVREREDANQTLLNWAYANTQDVPAVQANKAVKQVPVYAGADNVIPVGTTQDIIVTVPQQQKDQLTIKTQLPARLYAPLKKGQIVGTVEVWLGQHRLATHDVQTLQAVGPAGFLGRLWDNFRVFIHQ